MDKENILKQRHLIAFLYSHDAIGRCVRNMHDGVRSLSGDFDESDFLMEGFAWRHTKEGDDYWRRLYYAWQNEYTLFFAKYMKAKHP